LSELAPQDESAPIPAAKPKRRFPWRFLVYLAFIYTVWCTTLYLFQDKLLFPADVAPDPLPTEKYDASTLVLERTLEEGGKVVAWYMLPHDPHHAQPAPLVIFFHGNAELIDYQSFMVEGYHRLGFGVLLPEYRGYGRSAGVPSEQGIVDDAIYFYDKVIDLSSVDRIRIVMHGRSLGGGPAAGLAAARRPAALVLESTFTSAASMAHKYFAPSFLAKSPFWVDRVVESLDAPILILHGTHDDIIPVAHGRALRELARRPTYIEYDCAHNDFPGDANEEQYWNDIADFLAAAGVIEDRRP